MIGVAEAPIDVGVLKRGHRSAADYLPCAAFPMWRQCLLRSGGVRCWLRGVAEKFPQAEPRYLEHPDPVGQGLARALHEVVRLRPREYNRVLIVGLADNPFDGREELGARWIAMASPCRARRRTPG